MRVFEFVKEDSIIIEASAADVMPMLQQLGFKDLYQQTKNKIKLLVSRKQREATADLLLDKLPGSTASDDKKIIYYDGTRIDVKPIEAQHGGRDPERAQCDELCKLFQTNFAEGESELDLIIGEKLVKAAGTIKMTEGIKADTAVVDSNDNQVAWISLKDGPSAKNIPHWGGVSHHPISQHPEVLKFIDDIKARFPDGIPRGSTYGRSIEDTQLKLLSTFGKKYGSENGPSNVDMILQGTPKLKKTKNGFELVADNVWLNGDIPSGDYDPVLMVRFAPDRSNFGIPNARIQVTPNKSRSWKPLDKVQAPPKPEITDIEGGNMVSLSSKKSNKS